MIMWMMRSVNAITVYSYMMMQDIEGQYFVVLPTCSSTIPVIFGELTEKLHDQYMRRLVTAQGLRGLMGSLNRLLDAKYSKMNKLRKSMWGERANQRLLKVPTITVNQTPHTEGMFDLCVESDIYTTMLARLVRVEGVKVPSADNTGNEIDKN